MGNLGPMAGQNNHFNNYAVEKLQYAMDRYRNEVDRSAARLKRAPGRSHLRRGLFDRGDMAIYPWIVPYERQGHRSLRISRISSAGSKATARGRQFERAKAVNPNMGGIRTPEERAILFGQHAASVERAAGRREVADAVMRGLDRPRIHSFFAR